jgi:phospholipid-translocating P-type ATPase (flippase)
MERNWREVQLANVTHNLVYGTNVISTTRYTALNFFPANLMEQLKRTSILWFVFTGILQASFTELYEADNWLTLIVISLMIVFTVSKNLAQDIIRLNNDKQINARPVEVFGNSGFTAVSWRDIKVGNVVSLKTGDTAPADLLVLAGSMNGTCLADLKLLTGRKNLSEKTAVRETQILLQGWEQRSDLISKLDGDLLIPQPSSDINHFEGKLRLKGYPRAAPLTAANLLPRDSIILQTENLLCLVVYVGDETKMMMSHSSTTRKVSRLESRLNKVCLLFVLFAVVLSFICAGSSAAMEWDDDLNFGEHLVSYLLLYKDVIPITIFFLLDAIRLLQLVLIQRSGRIKMTTCDVNDEIGQIEYLLTDKTGTLTNAELKLRMCRVGGNDFVTDAEIVVDSEESVDGLVKQAKNTSISVLHANSQPLSTLALRGDRDVSQMFLLGLVLCNNVYPQPNGELLAESADEIAMVTGAGSCGYKLLERSKYHARVSVQGVVQEYLVHAILPFSSETRRMSTLIQRVGSSQAYLLVKGAADVMKVLCNLGSREDAEEELTNSLDCLRSIVFACKGLEESVTAELVSTLEYSRGVANEEGRVLAALTEHEEGLRCLGTAYLEETVNPDIGESVQRLRQAGVKVWMVTGDSPNSAYSVAVASRLTTIETEHLELLSYTSQFDLKRNLTKAIKRCLYGEYDDMPLSRLTQSVGITALNATKNSRAKHLGGLKAVGASQKLFKSVAVNLGEATEFLEEPLEMDLRVKFTMTIDGKTLELALADPDSRKILTCLMFTSEAVLGCNMLPSHKADLVRLLQRNLVFKPRVMAVGDGNNDISMIRQANVGVGISPQFSSQAANTSDVMAKEFSDLCELILNHGLKSHSSLAKSLLLALYGNLTLTLLLFYYNFTADYSSSSIINPAFSVGFCLIFFILPLFAIGGTDNNSYATRTEAYKKSFQFKLFAKNVVLRYVLISLVHSGLLFMYVYPSFLGIINNDGHTETVDLLGLTLFIALVLTVLLQCTLEISRPHFAFVVTFCLNIVLLFSLAYGSSQTASQYDSLQSSFEKLQSSPVAIIAMLFAPLACLAVSLIITMLWKSKKAQVAPEQNLGRLSRFTGGLHRVYHNYKGWDYDEDTEVYKVNPFTVQFKSAYTEVKYKNFYYSYQLRAIRVSVSILAVSAVLYTILAGALGDSDVPSTVLRAGFSLALISVVVWSAFSYFKKVYIRVILLLVFISILGKFILEIISLSDGTLAASFTPPMIFTLFCVDYFLISLFSVANIVLTQISEYIYLSDDDSSHNVFAASFCRLLVLTLGITAISAAVGYTVEVNNRKRFEMIEVSQIEIQKTQSILSFLLPAFVKERVKDGARYIAEDQGTVTIVFCDIYDFDRICAEYSPSELTDFLDDMFRKFDLLCDVHGVTKIETVGKTYMACAGLKDSEADMPAHMLMRSHARRGVDMGLDILRTTKSMKLKFGEYLKVKIGVNSGPVTAGVVGHHKPQFALVGDTVNTAARMCSTLPEANSIQITAQTYELLNRYEGLEFIENQVEAKGKGTMHTKIVRENKLAGQVIIETTAMVLDTSPVVPKPVQSQNVYDDKSLLARRDTELISRIFSCQFKETKKQKEFRVGLLEHSFRVMFAGVVTSLVVNSLLLLISILEYNFIDNYAEVSQITCRVIMTILVAVLLAVLSRIYKTVWYLVLVGMLTLFHAIVALMSLIENSDMRMNLAASELIFVLLFLSHSSGLFFIRVLPLSVVILALWLGLAVDDSSGADYGVPTVYIGFVILINAFAVYYRESNMRTFANLKLIVDKENQKTESLLQYMMPAHVYENLKEDKAVTDRLPSVAMLFADICGFTAWSSDKTPIEVVGMLSELFTNFDILCVQFNVFKVCTIGDCYVVMGYTGLEHRDPGDECARVLEFAFAMIQAIKDLNTKHGSELNMRIGLHLGEVIAGITGTNIVRYDIYGPDVLIANKMESGGQPGRINVSDRVRSHVESKQNHKYTYEFNTDISAKSVNRTHKSYFVNEVSDNQLS